jgi:aspartate racemase
MKTIGLIGGMTCESSLEYYRIINETVRTRLGGVHSARSIMVSVDFHDIDGWMRQEKWAEIAAVVAAAAESVEAGGADFLVICTNTIHKLADEVQRHVQIPLLHIGDVTAQAIKRQGLQQVGLLGTRFTMEEDFYRGRLREKHGLEVVIPDTPDRQTVDRVINEELSIGVIKDSSRSAYQGIIASLVEKGAQGVILGCTEIPLLVKPADSPVPVFDTTRIHAEAAVDLALQG